MVGRYKKTGFPWRKIILLCKLVSDLCPIDILTGEIAVKVTGVVGVSPALCYFRYIASIFLTLHKRLWVIVRFVDIGGIVDHYWLMFKISFYNIVLDVSNGQINGYKIKITQDCSTVNKWVRVIVA